MTRFLESSKNCANSKRKSASERVFRVFLSFGARKRSKLSSDSLKRLSEYLVRFGSIRSNSLNFDSALEINF